MLALPAIIDCILSATSIWLFNYVTNDPNPVNPKKTRNPSKSDELRTLRLKESKVISDIACLIASTNW